MLVIMDGSKGLRAAVRKAFERYAVVQRCQWHKRENVVNYLPTGEQQSWRRRLQSAYNRPTYQKAHAALQSLRKDLAQRNESAAASLDEGLDETLTLHRLGVYAQLGASLKTTAWSRSTRWWSSAVRRWIAGRAPTSVIAGSRAPCSTASRGCVG